MASRNDQEFFENESDRGALKKVVGEERRENADVYNKESQSPNLPQLSELSDSVQEMNFKAKIPERRKHVKFLDYDSKQESHQNHPSNRRGRMPLDTCHIYSESDHEKSHEETPVSKEHSPGIKMKQYTSRVPETFSKILSRIKSPIKGSAVSSEERQKRTFLLNEDESSTASIPSSPMYTPGSHPHESSNGVPEGTSLKYGTQVSENTARLGTFRRNDWTIRPASLHSPTKLSRENLSALDRRNGAPVPHRKTDHSLACALINILGGLILGYSDVGVNTALSVLYPCAMRMVPEHNYMWWVSGLLSTVNVGAATGALLGGYSAERFGRKWSMVAGGIFSLAPLMTMLVRGFYLHMLSRIITGVGVGFTSSICGTYVSEMAPASRRGFLNSFFEVSINSGILIANIAAYFILGVHRDMEVDSYCSALGDCPDSQMTASYRMIWIIMLGAVVIACAFLLLTLSPLVPESSVWLARHGRTHESHQERDSVYSRSIPATPIAPKEYEPQILEFSPSSPHRSTQIRTDVNAIPRGMAQKHFDEHSLTMISVGWASAFQSKDDSIEERDAALHEFPVDSNVDRSSFVHHLPSHSHDEFIKPYDSNRVYKKPSLFRRILRARRPLVIAIVDAIALQLTGMYALMFYCHKFLEVGHINQKMLGTLGIMGWNWASTFISLSLVERVGRRRLLIPSMCILTLTILCMPLAIVYGKGATHGIFFLFLLLCLYIAAYEVGPGVLFWVICAEVFPQGIAQMSFALANFLQWVFMVLVTFLFPPLQKHLGGWVFGVFFLPSLVSTVFFYFCLPETRGRSRKDVALELSGRNWLVQNRKLW